MSFFGFQIPELLELLPPQSSWGWLYFLGLSAGLLWLAWSERPEIRAWGNRQWISLLLLILGLVASLFLIIVRLPLGGTLALPGVAAPVLGARAFLLIALPFMAVTAMLGTTPGMLLAGISGLALALIDTRSPFTALEFALIAYLFGWALRQPYRTNLFAWLRKAWFSALLLAVLYLPLLFIDMLLWLGGDFASSLSIVLSRVGGTWLAFALPILLAGFLLSVLGRFVPGLMPRVNTMLPSPTERSLQARIFSALIPVALLLFASLVTVVWIVAGQSSRDNIYGQIENSLDVAAQNLTFLLDTGQEQILEIAEDNILLTGNTSQIENYLEDKIQQVPYFEQFVLVDANLNTLAAFPISDLQGIQPSDNEIEAMQRAFGGLPIQSLTVPPLAASSKGAQLSYIASVPANGEVRAVLIGRSQIESNPFAQAILQSLGDFSGLGGAGLLINGRGEIAYHSGGIRLMEQFASNPMGGTLETSNAAGQQIIRGYQKAPGSQWSVAVEVPALVLQDLALSIALPQILLILLLGGVTALVLRVVVLRISQSIDVLALSGADMAAGKMAAKGRLPGDEISRLASVVDDLRQEVDAAEAEKARLLAITEGLAAGSSLADVMDAIAEEALKFGASSARLIVGRADGKIQDEYGAGRKNKNYRVLDSQMLSMSAAQKRVLLTNPSRAPLDFGNQAPPQALAALALQGDGPSLGVLILAFDGPQNFPAEQVQYYEQLAGYAALALEAEGLRRNLGAENSQTRQMLQEILDPLLLCSPEGEVVFANRAAKALLSPGADLIGRQLRDFPQLAALPAERWEDVRFGDGRVFSVKVIEINEHKRLIGLGILMKDTTSEKQAKALRSEFLTTVSHELQSPIQLLRGYLTMLDMTGGLNEKQSAYMTKIGESVNSMGDLVSSLLDLERIENEQGLQLTELSFGKLLARVAQETQPRSRQKQLKVEWQAEAVKDLKLQADETLLERAIYNLVDHAIRQSPRGEEVVVQAGKDNGFLRFSVSDKGSGIAPMDLPYVFERLSGASPGESENQGRLTLSVVKSIVQRHGGKVWADSQLGQGSTYYLEIPTGNPLKS